MSLYNVVFQKEYVVSDDRGSRRYQDIVLDCAPYGLARFTMSLPKKRTAHRLPLILIVGGLKTGRSSLDFVPDHGEGILVAYEYPPVMQHSTHLKGVWNLWRLRRAALSIPYQLLTIIRYLKEVAWRQIACINVMGYSFGSIFIPATYIYARDAGVILGPGVLAYGGVGLYCLLKANLRLPLVLKGLIAYIGAKLFKKVDPIVYASQLRSEFLLINGTQDSQIPIECAKVFQKRVPEPKTILDLDTAHIDPDNRALILRLIEISREWLAVRAPKR